MGGASPFDVGIPDVSPLLIDHTIEVRVKFPSLSDPPFDLIHLDFISSISSFAVLQNHQSLASFIIKPLANDQLMTPFYKLWVLH